MHHKLCILNLTKITICLCYNFSINHQWWSFLSSIFIRAIHSLNTWQLRSFHFLFSSFLFSFLFFLNLRMWVIMKLTMQFSYHMTIKAAISFNTNKLKWQFPFYMCLIMLLLCHRSQCTFKQNFKTYKTRPSQFLLKYIYL